MVNIIEDNDQAFMKMALREAVKARGRTSPNPLVGAIIVRDGEVVGRGYHKRAGTPHAEVNAIQNAGDKARGAAIYVTLEPCNHQGRTPPCTRAVLEAGLRRVVIGMPDPNPGVAGGGAAYLQSQGLTVSTGILEDDCRKINRPFIKLVTKGVPWVIMKAGLSLDGRIAAAHGRPGWITNERSRRFVHRLRDRADAILVGIGTALNDDPSLTTRLPGGGHQDPLRVVLDSSLRLPPAARMLTQQSPADTLIFCAAGAEAGRKGSLMAAGAEIVELPTTGQGRPDLHLMLRELGRRGICSLLVEGGSKVHASFLSQGLVDQANLFYGPLFMGGDAVPLAGPLGLGSVDEAPRLREINCCRHFGNDVMIEGTF